MRTISSCRPPGLRGWVWAATLALAGCASTAIDVNFDHARTVSEQHLGARPRWLTSDEARRDARLQVDALLTQPLSGDDAVRIALAYSPALQSLLFQQAEASAQATQSARMPNPVFTFERLVRRAGGETEIDIGRMISFSVFDLLMWPARQRLADLQQQQARLRLSGDVVQAATRARQAWVRAVAAGQSLRYAEQVNTAADAGAELARRMQAAGNFSRLQRAREQAYSAQAVAQLARARQAAQSAREELVRVLGLDDTQAAALQLPQRLPDLPVMARDEASVAQVALDQRLDLRLARAELDALARQRGLTRVTSVVNGLHVAGVRNSETGEAPQKGYELEFELPIFDAGDAARAGSQARYMAALNRTAQLAVEASSQVRESYGSYRTAYDVARHYRDEIVPLQKTIAEENLLRYNGMLIGVFELLADTREQIGTVMQAIDAQRDFWLADAALQSALIGRPAGSVALESPAAAPAAAGAH
ncbi:TolC family protein [Schlegelella sp. S2-27]|uniref:TolC family protein n=1 Tax=Caldimonas mangrovi TaxID=2944811 RepID=A0ABT0YNR7_9BURK|nr:TolC family protein [Caldimonas mangrovi]MCM5680367.1 TolC family protein [Caldimonas mangrovi]